MNLVERYQNEITAVLKKAGEIQKDKILEAGRLIAEAAEKGHKIYLGNICHSIEKDLINRGGGPAFYRSYKEESDFKAGDVLVVSSVSGRTEKVVNLAYDCVKKGITVIAFVSMEYASSVDPVHPSGKKLYEIADLTIDNCAPEAEALLEVEGIEAKFAAVSGITSDYLMWSITAAAVEKLLKDGYTPGIFKSINYPGGKEYYDTVIKKYEETGM